MLRGDRQDDQRDTGNQDSTQVEVVSELSALYPLIYQRRDSLPRDLKDELESDSDDAMIDENIHNNIIYEPGSSSASIPRHGSNNGF